MNLGNGSVLLLLCCFLSLGTCFSIDTISPNRTMKDGDLLVSRGETFALGFFSPGKSGNRYVGIWYNKLSERTVVWVANKDNPITDSSGVLSIDDSTGNLVLHSQNRNLKLWSTNISSTGSVSARLLDSGNLVLFSEGNDRPEDAAWQSFDYPSNTLMPDMKLGVDKKTGRNRFMNSWKSSEDPGTGEYTYKIDLKGKPQLFLNKGPVPLWRTGTWDGQKWNGVPEMTPKFIFNVSYVENQDEVYVVYRMRNPSILSRMVLNESGIVERLTWHEGENRWVGFWSAPKEQCDYFSHCGSFGNCDPYIDASSFECKCLPGFEPKLAHDWYLRDGSKGCVRKQGARICETGEGFVKVANAKIPDTAAAMVNMTMGLEACRELCLKNCSCSGYSNSDISREGSGCITWYGDMIDTRQFASGGQDMYIRVDAAELAQQKKNSKGFHGKYMVAIVVSGIAAMLILITLCLTYCWVIKRKKKGLDTSEYPFSITSSSKSYDNNPTRNEINESQTNSDVVFFHLSTIFAATDNFSPNNKLGEGGFGSVYKGQLQNGQEIAVKRLSQNSGQGVEEFKNEVTLIAKLQHRNLVKLLGCCIQKEEKMLIYEYLPNKGLDYFIFDKARASLLDWRCRFEIIMGIVRGMIYLHQDSRLRIIHRDLKASNVLLDANMKPKISDFGMARIFGVDQIEANTNRVVGTYGYMSPEYALEGQFSMKSDVFSFGIILLEIITGRKNNSYYSEYTVNLIGHIWELWKEGKALEAVDESMGDCYDKANEIARCIEIGLLCVQEFAIDRPTMTEVASMLSNETSSLPTPHQPAFIFNKRSSKLQCSSSGSAQHNSVNDLTITMVQPR